MDRKAAALAITLLLLFGSTTIASAASGPAGYCRKHPEAPRCLPAPVPSPTVPLPTPNVTPDPTPLPTPDVTSVPVAYVLDDEFDGPTLAAVWGTASHWTGLSEAVADRAMLSVANGYLTIKAERDATGRWHAGELDTWGRLMPTFGYFEARLRFTAGKGLWPAFWTAHDWTGDKSELDINETLANPYTGSAGDNAGCYYATVHLADGSTPDGSHRYCPGYDLAGGWHVYGMDWRATGVTFLFDDVPWYTYTGTVPVTSQAVILNLAVGGWAGASDGSTPSPAYLDVDWVRVRR